jgi:hypothetical protein
MEQVAGTMHERDQRFDELCPEYIAKVIKTLFKEKDQFNAERSKEVTEQETALLNLKLAIASRLKPESSVIESSPQAVTLAFDIGMDDDEAVLRLMFGVDADSNGAISKEELVQSSLLNLSEHRDIRNAFEAAFGCDLQTMDDALAHLDAKHFGEFYSIGKQELAAENEFDRKASVNAVFDAAIREATAHAPESEASTSTAESCTSVIVNGTQGAGSKPCETANTDINSRVSKAGLERLAVHLRKVAGSEKLASALDSLSKSLHGDGVELDFLAVKRAVRRVPRVAGQRMEWAKGVGLDGALARHMPPGTLEDGLEGVRKMTLQKAQLVLTAFFEDVKFKFLTALLRVKTTTGSKSAVEANSKFADGFQGSFATLRDFHAGAEASLQLGYPNPDIEKGMRHEHTGHPSAARLFVTPNYRIATSLLIEYAWAMFEESPADLNARELFKRALNQLNQLTIERKGSEHSTSSAESGAGTTLDGGRLLFPGEVGDSFSESLVILRFPGVASSDSVTAKRFGYAARQCAEGILTTEEEKVRGVSIIGHGACMEWSARSASVLLSDPSGPQAATGDKPLLVGVLLPMFLASAEAKRDALCARIANSVRTDIVEVEVTGCKTWTFSKYTGLKGLRKWLGELSLDELLGMIAADTVKKDWDVDSSKTYDHDELCSAMASSYVCTELRADLRAALKGSASDAQIEAVLRGWHLEPPQNAERLDQIEQAAEALDSEERWKAVEGWVQLYRGRIQGRTRLGINALMLREGNKIKRYGLTKGEVLALYLYTGPEFVPLNGICRSYPPAMVKLLKGDGGTTADNRLCTTLFCISSAIKKLSQTTELPESRCSSLHRP